MAKVERSPQWVQVNVCVYMCISIHACIVCLHAAIVFEWNNVEFSAYVFLCVFQINRRLKKPRQGPLLVSVLNIIVPSVNMIIADIGVMDFQHC